MSNTTDSNEQQGEPDEQCPWCQKRPQRYLAPANNPHDPCGGLMKRVRCITYQCPLNCFEMSPEDWNSRRASLAAVEGDALKAGVSAMWEALKREACKVPDEAKQIVFLGEQKFRKAMAPFVAPARAAGNDEGEERRAKWYREIITQAIDTST